MAVVELSAIGSAMTFCIPITSPSFRDVDHVLCSHLNCVNRSLFNVFIKGSCIPHIQSIFCVVGDFSTPYDWEPFEIFLIQKLVGVYAVGCG